MDFIIKNYKEFIFIDEENGVFQFIKSSKNDTMENVIKKYYENKYLKNEINNNLNGK